MNIAIFGLKHGVGTSVLTATIGRLASESDQPVYLVDWHGDLDAVLGVSNVVNDEVRQVADNLYLLTGHTYDNQPHLIDKSAHLVIHDCGVFIPDDLKLYMDIRIAVTQLCYLALRNAVRENTKADHLIVHTEPGRALSATDCERATGIAVISEVAHDPMVARSVDAGLLAARPPMALRKSLQPVVDLLTNSAKLEAQND